MMIRILAVAFLLLGTGLVQAQWNDPGDGQRMQVIVNHEEQYSIWPTDRDLPAGWRAAGFEGSKQACLDYIDRVWTDMRPRSQRPPPLHGFS